MKKITITLLVLLALTISSTNLLAQGPPPPPPGSGHGQSGNQTGGNAPVGGGLFILLGLGAAYGGQKIYEVLKEEDKAAGKPEELED